MKFQVTFSDCSVNANSISLFIKYSGGEKTKVVSFYDALIVHFENQVDLGAPVLVENWNGTTVVFKIRSGFANLYQSLAPFEMYAGGFAVPIYEFMTRFFYLSIIDALLKEFAQEIREEMEERDVAAEEDIDVQAWRDYFRGLHI